MTPPAARDIVITGLGAVSALGADCAELQQAVLDRRTGIAPIRRFPTDDFSVHLGAMVADDDSANDLPASAPALARRFAVQALREALSHAGIEASRIDHTRIALVLGTGLADPEACVHAI